MSDLYYFLVSVPFALALYFLSSGRKTEAYWSLVATVEMVAIGLIIFQGPAFSQSVFGTVDWRAYLVAVLILLGIAALLEATRRFLEPALPPIEAHEGGAKTPSRYRVHKILATLGPGHELTVVARSCARWLVSNDWMGKVQLREAIVAAVRRGAQITFVLQAPSEGFSGLSDSERSDVLRDHHDAVDSYQLIKLQLESRQLESLSLKYLKRPVENSIVIQTKFRKLVRLIRDISMNKKEKAFVVVNEERLVSDLVGDYREMIGKALNENSYNLEIGQEALQSLVESSPQWLKSRRNSSANLLNHAAQVFVGADTAQFPPPLSIQLQLSNVCTTKCRMCTHFTLEANAASELSLDEIRNGLEWIHDLGTLRVVLSGGEPLAHHSGILEILNAVQKTKLRAGLLTSGIARNSTPITLDVANAIRESCEWVQVSVDSFNSVRYESIRHDRLETCLESIRTLLSRGVRNVEMCFTIQKQNVDEVISGEATREAQRLLPGVELRFKFAHGENAPYVVDEKSAAEAAAALAKVGKPYLGQMLERRVFTTDGIAAGLPLRARNEQFAVHEHTCQALSATLLIDANGDVYPCCYLYDDNTGTASKYRSEYRLGTLRARNGLVPKRRAGVGNPLQPIWHGAKLKELRDTVLPVRHEACGKCTRHVHQNQFLNEVNKTFREYAEKGYDLAGDTIARRSPSDLWI